MTDKSLQHRFDVLCQITRAQHFAWRQAVADLCPEVDTARVVDKMWERTGEQTGAAYARRIDKSEPLAKQVAASIVWSSACMGEDAHVEAGVGDEAFVVHADCPWFHWHKRLDLLSEDRPGCDVWFQTTLERVNSELGTCVRCETTESLPDGDECCRRRFWVE
ncbi:MAG: hypothetical protein JRI68_03575 [Deltaproteobacteria bacterium]|nr:hypothetical protein [Deltaproteobacteria bacterium]